ncbi:MAG: WD40 repeat domain-containing serine/threonine protein kinase [Gemmataceae bacterium]
MNDGHDVTIPPEEPDDSQSTIKREPQVSGHDALRESMSVMGATSVIPSLLRESLDRVGEYELLEEVARGGMGVVFKARHERLQRLVALKMILHGHLANADSRSRFHLEATAVAQLQHPGIVSIYEVGSHDGQPYFTMEFVDGMSLEQRLKEGPLPGHQAAEYLEKTARAVHFAHSRRILHRDLKPANVLIDEHHQPKVTDFGLAKALDDDSRQTRTGAIMGTPSYMAPEQALARKDLGPSCDIYALGAILYELLTGRPPFQGETPMATMTMVIEQEPVAPRLLNPHVDRDLETICLKCLEKAPHRRYLSAELLANDLRNYLDGQPIQARRTGMIGRALKWCRRNPSQAALILVSVLGTLLLVAGGIAFGLEQRRLRRDADLARLEAEQATRNALQSEREARQAEEFARRQYKVSRHLLYATQFRLSRGIWEAGNRARALEWLNGWQQTFKDERDPRGWEYYYLHRLCEGKAVLLLPNRRVTGMVFDPASRFLVTADDTGDVRWWELASGRTTQTIHASDFGVRALEFSADGKQLATAAGDRSVKKGIVQIWDSATGKQLCRIDAGSKVHALAFNQDGKVLATGHDDHKIRLWDAASGRPLSTLDGHSAPVVALRYTPDGALASGAGKEVRINYLTAGRKPLALPQSDRVRQLTIDKQHQRLLVLCEDKYLYLFDLNTGKKGKSLYFGGQAVGVAEDGNLIASCSKDADVAIWMAAGDGQSYTKQFESRWYVQPVSLVALSGNRHHVACATDDGTVWIGFTMGGQEAYAMQGHTESVRALAFSRARGQLISAGDDGLRLWGQNGNGRLQPATGGLTTMAVSPRGDLIAVARRDRTIQILDAGFKEVAILTGHENTVHSLSFNRDGSLLASGSDDQTVRLWDPRSGTLKDTWKGHNGPVVAVAFSPRGDQIASGSSSDDVIRLWDLKGHSLFLRGHTNGVVCLAFNNSGSRLASGGYDKTVRIWDMSDLSQRPLEGHTKVVNCVAFSSDTDSTRLASGSGDHTVRVWDVVTRQELLKLDAGDSDVTSVLFVGLEGRPPRQLMAGSHDRLIRIWEAE